MALILRFAVGETHPKAIAWVERQSDRFRLELDERGVPVRVVAV